MKIYWSSGGGTDDFAESDLEFAFEKGVRNDDKVYDLKSSLSLSSWLSSLFLLGSSSPLKTPIDTAIPNSTKPSETTAQKPVARVDMPG